MQKETKALHLKTMHHLSTAFQKPMAYKLTMQKIQMLYSKNYKQTTGSLWNYYRDEPSNPLSSNSESFKYKTSITRNTYDGDDDANKIVVLLKHLSNFWRTLNVPLINCEIELILIWSKNCALADMILITGGNNNDPPAIVASTRLEFQITGTKLYVPVVTLQQKMT